MELNSTIPNSSPNERLAIASVYLSKLSRRLPDYFCYLLVNTVRMGFDLCGRLSQNFVGEYHGYHEKYMRKSLEELDVVMLDVEMEPFR